MGYNRRDPGQAQTARAALEAHGIETRLDDENTAQWDPLYSPALGGVKLLVHQDAAEQAAEILGLEKPHQGPPCESCKSTNTVLRNPRTTRGFLAVLAFMIVGTLGSWAYYGVLGALVFVLLFWVVLAPGGNQRLCITCGKSWRIN